MLSFDSRMSGSQSVKVAHFTSAFYTRELSLLLSTRISWAHDIHWLRLSHSAGYSQCALRRSVRTPPRG